tara:strand:+ start:1064 stop:1762 length:699 start_codon:yes stop_codon:yes gene_type:complete
MLSFEEYFSKSLIKFEEARHDVKEISTDLQQKHGWDIQSDLRIRVFEQINNVMQPYSLTLLYGEKCISDDGWVKRVLQPMTVSDVEGVRNTYEVFIRNAFIYSFTSVVEACMRSFVRAVSPQNRAVNDFSKVKAALFETLGNSEPVNVNSALQLLFSFRNCIHNNGMHYSRSGETTSILYRGINHSFEEAALQRSGSLDVLLMILKDVVDLFVFVVEHQKIKSLDIVRDDGT